MLIKGKAEFQPQAQRHSLKKKNTERFLPNGVILLLPLTSTPPLSSCRNVSVHTELSLWIPIRSGFSTASPVSALNVNLPLTVCVCVSLCMNTLSLTCQLTCVSVWFFTTIYVNRLSHSFLHNIHLIWFNTHVHFTIFTSLFLIWFVNFFQLTFVSPINDDRRYIVWGTFWWAKQCNHARTDLLV